MKSIEDTLRTIRDIISAFPSEVNLAVVGGYAAIFHGVERTTLDIDLCLYSNIIQSSDSVNFFHLLKDRLPERFHAELIEASKIQDDPFKHDVIFIDDTAGDFMRIDLLIARYRWELDAIREAITMPGIPLPVISKPYLVAMKLQSTGLKDAGDIVGLMGLMTEDEKAKTLELAKRTGKNKKLALLLSPPAPEEEAPQEEIL